MTGAGAQRVDELELDWLRMLSQRLTSVVHVQPAALARLLDAYDAQAREAADHRTRCHTYDPDAVIAHLQAVGDLMSLENAALRNRLAQPEGTATEGETS